MVKRDGEMVGTYWRTRATAIGWEFDGKGANCR